MRMGSLPLMSREEGGGLHVLVETSSDISVIGKWLHAQWFENQR